MLIHGKQLRPSTVPRDALEKFCAAVQLGAAFTITTNTLADVPMMNFALEAFATYAFQWDLLVTQSSGSGIVGVGVNYNAAVTRVAASALLSTSATGITSRGTQTNNTAMVDNAARAAGGPFPAIITGSITTGAAGTLSLRAQRSAGTTVIAAGSCGFILEQ